MATLTPGQPLPSKEPVLLVENKLDPGRWRFQLVVVDDEANESAPAEIVVQVNAPAPAPTPTPTPTPTTTVRRPIRPILVEEVATPRIRIDTTRPLIRPK